MVIAVLPLHGEDGVAGWQARGIWTGGGGAGRGEEH